MHRFYVPKENIAANRVDIKGDDARHITRVLRLRTGDSLVICDGQNTDYDGEILKIDRDRITVGLDSPRISGTEPPVDIVVFQSIPKGQKMDLLIQKGTELGIRRFVPVVTSRTVVKLDGDKGERKKISRWQRIAEEGAKQSGRGIIPEVLPPVDFGEAVSMAGEYDLKVMPYVGERSGTIAAITAKKGDIRDIAVFIGPEGGFDEREAEQARARGIYTVKLGPRIMRTETAGLVLASILMYRFGDIGGI